MKTRIRLYQSLVQSILLYNCSTWSLSKSDEKQLNSFHRRQLREVVGIKWPHKIENKALYNLTKTRQISIDITERRWKMFGHALRMHPNTPAQRAMKYFFETRSNPKFLGRKRTSIVTTLNRDITNTRRFNPEFPVKKKLKSEFDLQNIGVLARKRNMWFKIVSDVVKSAAYSDTSLQSKSKRRCRRNVDCTRT